MAIAATVIWEVNNTADDATASDDNGGGFNASCSGATKTLTDNYTYGASKTVIALTDLEIYNTTNNQIHSDTRDFVAADIGHIIQITAGTDWTAGAYEITAVTGTGGTNYATVTGVANITTSTSPGGNGTGNIGGALASPGMAAKFKVAGNNIYIKYSETAYSITSASTNISGGCIDDSTGGVSQTNQSHWVGYDSTRTLVNTDANRPLLQCSGSISSLTMINLSGTLITVRNVIVDGASKATSTGIHCSNNYTRVHLCKVLNTTTRGIYFSGSNSLHAYGCEATGCSGTAAIDLSDGRAVGCYSHDNTTHGFLVNYRAAAIYCISDTNTGANIHGFVAFSVGMSCVNCCSYANGGDGFNLDGNSGYGSLLVNCIAEANAGEGFGTDAVKQGAVLLNCAGYNNTGGNYSATNLANVYGFVNNTTGTFFTNAASGDFSLNATANQGALTRAAGYPGAYPAGTTTGYPDIGGVQHADPVILGRATGQATLAVETGAGARSGSGSAMKLTPTSESAYGYVDLLIYVTGNAGKLSFYYKSFKDGASSFNGTVKISMWDSDDPEESPPPLLASVDISGTYDETDWYQYQSASKTHAAEGLARIRFEIVDGSNNGGIYIDDIAWTDDA